MGEKNLPSEFESGKKMNLERQKALLSKTKEFWVEPLLTWWENPMLNILE